MKQQDRRTLTAHQRRVRYAMIAWCQQHKKGRVLSVRHIYPVAYVLGVAAPGAIIVAVPWVDAEATLRDWIARYPLDCVRVFDPALLAGGWCSVAYVSIVGSGQPVAIPMVPRLVAGGKR